MHLGIDVGGTGLKAGVVDEHGKLLSKVSCPTGVEEMFSCYDEKVVSTAKKSLGE